MNSKFFSSLALMAALSLNACAQSPAPVAETAAVPVRGKVQDVDAFQRFIAGKPTPERFHTQYPDVKLILPGTIATRELRMDRSRYFADLDAQGRIVGGKFQ